MINKTTKTIAVVGAAAGDVAVVGIAPSDQLVSVTEIDIVLTEGSPNTRAWAVADRTAEFSITEDDVINNVGGTSTAAKLLMVTFEVGDPRFGPRGIDRSTGL